MKQKPTLTLSDAKIVVAAARTFAEENGYAVSIAVSDEAGYLWALERLDGASLMSSLICQEKAKTSALGRRESKVFEDMINGGRTAFLSVSALGGMLEGGLPIVVDGVVVGAVGVSGVASSDDVRIAQAGIAALLATLAA